MASERDIDLENWMSLLPESVRTTPFIYIAIPGSHDSMTYGITRNSTLAPDAPPIIRQIWPFFKGAIIRWTKTQQIDVTEQLMNGIRYFDLRLATKVNTDNIYFTHGLYANEINGALQQIKIFLDSHNKEVVILDCQHFYDFQIEDHKKLFNILINTYGSRICPPRKDLESISLDSLNRYKQQVIVIYRNEVVLNSGRFWRNSQFPTPWPQQITPTGLLRWMSAVYRPLSVGFVLQAVLTPDVQFIILRWRSGIQDSCAKPVINQVLPWIESTLSPGQPPPIPKPGDIRVNVIISDFVDLNNNIFPKTVIALNYKFQLD